MDPTPDTLCPGCFTDPGGTHPCPHCGYDERTARAPLLLPHRTRLHGQFVVGRVLGKPGGFGITYLSWDLGLHRRVAIKEYLPRELAGRGTDRATVAPHSHEDGEAFRYGLEQFLAEARTLAQLDHPNIVRVHQVFEANGTAYLAMEFYAGLTLADYLDRKGGRLPESEALALMQPILDGLRAVHAKGFLHRDIKPQNIYLARMDGGGVRPILLDFGAARQAMGERSRSLSVVLTEGYAPFEQYTRKGKQGAWTDVYAAGAVLYRMVTGKIPPPAVERQETDEMLPAARFGVSPPVSDAIEQAMRIDGAQRLQDVGRFQYRLMAGHVDPIQPDPENIQFQTNPGAVSTSGSSRMHVSDPPDLRDIEPVGRVTLWIVNSLAGVWLLLNWLGLPIVTGGGEYSYGHLPAQIALQLAPVLLFGWSACALGTTLFRIDEARFFRVAIITSALAPILYISAAIFVPGLDVVEATPFYCILPWLFLSTARRVPPGGFLYFVVLVTWAHFLAGYGGIYLFGGVIGAFLSFLGLTPLTKSSKWRRTGITLLVFSLALGILAGPVNDILHAGWKLIGLELGRYSPAINLYFPWQFVFTLGLALLFQPTRSASSATLPEVTLSHPTRFGIVLRHIDREAQRRIYWLLAGMAIALVALGWQFHEATLTAHENAAYQQALSKGSAVALQSYIDACAPSRCRHKDEAERKLVEVKAKEARTTDDEAFRQARAANTFAGYQTYLNNCRVAEVCAHRPDAQTDLGYLYHKGTGVGQNDAQSVYWFRQAAESGLDRAQEWLGWMYREGRGVPRDDTQAVYWFRQAADQGYKSSQYWLGLMYHEGRGVTRDDVQALALLKKAAAQGHEAAAAKAAELTVVRGVDEPVP